MTEASHDSGRSNVVGRLLLVLLAALLAALYAGSMLSRTHGHVLFPLDDAYIYLQYAHRLAERHGLSYSPGDAASTGFTSPLYLLTLTPGALFGLHGDGLAAYAFVLNGVFLALAAVLARRLLSRFVRAGEAFVGSLLLLLSGPITWGFFSGMEIGLVSVLLLAAADAAVSDGEEGAWRRTPVLLVLLALSRPETVIVAFFVAAWGLSRRDATMSARWRLLLPLGAVAAWMLLNVALTGHAASSTARPKSPLFTPYFSHRFYAAQVGRWFWRAVQTLVAGITPQADPAAGGRIAFVPPLSLFLGALGGATLLAHERAAGRPGPGLVLVASTTGGILAVGFLSASFSHHGRYLIPFLAPLLVLLVPGAARLASVVGRRAPRIHEGAVRTALLVVLLLAQAATLAEFLPQYGADAQGFLPYRDAAIFIRDELPPDARVAVLDAGIVAYYGAKPVVDLFGLTTGWMSESTFYFSDYAGSKFEAMAARPPGERPGYFLAHRVRYDERGDEAHLAPLRRDAFRSFGSPPPGVPSVGMDLTLFRLDWSRLRPAPLPCAAVAGARLLDALNIADVADERAHLWRFGPSRPGSFTSNRLVVEACGDGRAADGVRGIDGQEEFWLDADGSAPGLLVLRLDLLLSPLEVAVNGTAVGTIRGDTAPGRWSELQLPLAAGILRAGQNSFRVSGRYRVARYWLYEVRPQS